MLKRAFRASIKKYLNSTSPREANRAKVKIEEIVAASTGSNTPKQIEEVLAEFSVLPQWIENHFTPGSLYTDRGWAFGWCRSDQVQALRLPIRLSRTYDKGYFQKMEVMENRDGFKTAVPLPLIDGLPVSIPPGQAHLLARYGWAAALPLQWHRTSDGYIVDHSILSCGFLVAWNWWPAAAKYYASNPPSQLPEYPEFSCEPVRDF